MTNLLEVNHLTVRFRLKEGAVHAVEDVSYFVREGESLGIVGESGSGKSVSSLAVMGLLPKPPAEIPHGQIMFEDKNLLEFSEARMRAVRGGQIAMIFQDPMTSLNPVMTIGRQIVEPLQLHLNLSRHEAQLRARELLDAVGIPEAARRLRAYPHQFSGGMRQRVMIAIAVAANPKLLIADEPTTALDVTVQAQILELINRLRKDLNTSVILITHDLGVVAGMTDRVNVMYAGHIAETAPTDELFADPRHPYTLGLLGSIPHADDSLSSELQTIPGSPPDLIRPPKGCPFQPRCPFAMEKCGQYPPDLVINGHHKAACWVDVTNPAEQARAAARGYQPPRRSAGAIELSSTDSVAPPVPRAGDQAFGQSFSANSTAEGQ